jgi:lysine 2,3-aminomutase
VCPVYCRFCTRSYAVGKPTEAVKKTALKPTRRRWDRMFDYIENTPAIQDVVVSGGDSYYLQPQQLFEIGSRLLSIPHIKRIRLATKGLAVAPMRILDDGDQWTRAFIAISDRGREIGKQVAMHTHFNHPNEITWITEQAAQKLFRHGVIIRNQSVLLRGVNDTIETMSRLIRKLADMNIQPYYVYQSDMVKGVEDLRTPLSTILTLEAHIRGTIAGFMTPAFVVDLPGGGGKRLANSFETYDHTTGISMWKAPGVTGEEVFEYYDPIASNEHKGGIELRKDLTGRDAKQLAIRATDGRWMGNGV